MLFDQLPLIWQVWGYMLLGAVLLGAGLFVGLEWPWLASQAHAAWRWARRTFTADGDDPYPQTAETIARAKAAQARERRQFRATPQDADEMLIAARGRALVFRTRQRAPHENDAERRRQLLALMESSPLPSRKTVH